MEKQFVLRLLLLAVHAIAASCYPTTVPAFVWSNNPSRYLGYDKQGSVNYNIISPGDLAKNVLNTAGWLQLLCSEQKRDQATEVALVFIDNKLHSQDISRKRDTNAELIELLEGSFKESDFSMAFPYVALSEERGSIANSLLSGFMENCDHGLRNIEIAVVAPCFMEGANIKKLPDLNAVNEYVNEKKLRTGEDTNLIFVCSDKSSAIEESGRTQLESRNLAKILMDLKRSGMTYSVLYTSDPYEMAPYLRFEKLERHLLSNIHGNTSANATYCDGICRSKASILEGLLVVTKEQAKHHLIAKRDLAMPVVQPVIEYPHVSGNQIFHRNIVFSNILLTKDYIELQKLPMLIKFHRRLVLQFWCLAFGSCAGKNTYPRIYQL